MRYILPLMLLILFAIVIFMIGDANPPVSPAPGIAPQLDSTGDTATSSNRKVNTGSSRSQVTGSESPAFASDPRWLSALGGLKGRLVHHDGKPAQGYTVQLYGGGKRGSGAPDSCLQPQRHWPSSFFEKISWSGSRSAWDWLTPPFFANPLFGCRFAPLPAARSLTTTTGVFQFNRLFPGTGYVFRVTRAGRTIYLGSLRVRPRSGEVLDLGLVSLPSFSSLTGTMEDDRGRPVAGVRVRAVSCFVGRDESARGLVSEADWVLTHANNPGRASTMFKLPDSGKRVEDLWSIPECFSDRRGQYQLTDLAPGQYLLQATASGLRQVDAPLAMIPGRSTVDIRMTRSCHTRLTVKDAEGKGIASAQVLFGSATVVDSTDHHCLAMEDGGFTDRDGLLELSGLPTGFIVYAVRRDASRAWIFTNPVRSGTNMTVTLPPGISTRIRCVEIIDPEQDESAPVDPDSVLVTQMGSTCPLAVKVIHGPGGVIDLEGLQPGGYELDIRKKGYLPRCYHLEVHPGDREGNERRPVILQKGITVDVLVLDARGKPLPGAAVANDSFPRLEASRLPKVIFRTGSDGRVKAGPLPRLYGEVNLRAWHPAFPDHCCCESVEDSGPITMKLSMGSGSVSGQVIPVERLGDQPLLVYFRRDLGESIAIPDRNGVFNFDHLFPGEYQVSLGVTPGGYVIDTSSISDFRQLVGQKVTIEAGKQTNLILSLPMSRPACGTISGVVKADKTPIPKAIVGIAHRRVLFGTSDREVAAGKDGRFTIPDVVPGWAGLFLKVPDPNRPGVYLQRNCEPDEVTLIPGQTLEVEIKVPAGGIDGVIVDGQGKPLAGITIGLEQATVDKSKEVLILAEIPARSILRYSREEVITSPTGSFHFNYIQGPHHLDVVSPGLVLKETSLVNVPVRGRIKVTLMAIRTVRVPVQLQRASRKRWELKALVVTPVTSLLGKPIYPIKSDPGNSMNYSSGIFYIDLPPGFYNVEAWENNKTGVSHPPAVDSPGYPLVSTGALKVPSTVTDTMPVFMSTGYDPATRGAIACLGTVLDKKGKPLSKGTLRISSTGKNSHMQFVRAIKVDEKGCFTYPLPPGKYNWFYQPHGKAGYTHMYWQGRFVFSGDRNEKVVIKIR